MILEPNWSPAVLYEDRMVQGPFFGSHKATITPVEPAIELYPKGYKPEWFKFRALNPKD